MKKPSQYPSTETLHQETLKKKKKIYIYIDRYPKRVAWSRRRGKERNKGGDETEHTYHAKKQITESEQHGTFPHNTGC